RFARVECELVIVVRTDRRVGVRERERRVSGAVLVVTVVPELDVVVRLPLIELRIRQTHVARVVAPTALPVVPGIAVQLTAALVVEPGFAAIPIAGIPVARSIESDRRLARLVVVVDVVEIEVLILTVLGADVLTDLTAVVPAADGQRHVAK